MKTRRLLNKKGFVGIIGLIIAVAIICVLAFFVYKAYFKKSTGASQGESLFLRPLEEGQKYETPVDTTRRELDTIKQRINTRESQLFGK